MLKKYIIVVAALLFGVGVYVVQRPQQQFQAHLSRDWYPQERSELLSVLDQAEHDSRARCGQMLDIKSNIKAIIVPHAGYKYAADIAVSGYKRLEGQKIARVIILAPSHAQAFKGAALPHFVQYQTPLGVVDVDVDAVQYLQKHSLCTVVEDIWKKEHAVEVQLPYIQRYIGNHVKIVPLIIAAVMPDELKSIAQALVEFVDDATVVVISSDFIHYGTRFGYTPFNRVENVQASIKKLDMVIADAIMQQDASTFEIIIEKTGATVCGRAPIVLFKMIEQQLPYQLIGQLLCYKTSYDVDHADPTSSVSYATIIFEQQREILFSHGEKKRILDEVRAIIAASCDGHKQQKNASLLQDISHLQEWRGLFVTLRTKDGRLRGCMGRVTPDKSLINLLPEVSRLAAFGDPRFNPVSCNELGDLHIEVSILSTPRPISSYEEIILGKHGIILSAHGKVALFLPNVALEQGWDLATTLSELAQKAGLPHDAWQTEAARFQVFDALDFKE